VTPTTVTPTNRPSLRFGEVLAEVRELAPAYQLPTSQPEDGSGNGTEYQPVPVLQALVQAAGTDAEGRPVSKEVAAQRLVSILRDTRSVSTPEGRRDPLGVVVDANVVLEGLHDRRLQVSWSIWSVGGNRRLFGQWLREVPAYYVTAESERETASFDFWVPIPKGRGKYEVRLLLRDGEAVLASKRSAPFG